MPASNHDLLSLRIATIMQKLYEGQTLTKYDLALEFNVSEKTIQRDMNDRVGTAMDLNYERGRGWSLEMTVGNTPQHYAQILEQDEGTMKQLQLSLMKARDALDDIDFEYISAPQEI